jgi:hypothetical protein
VRSRYYTSPKTDGNQVGRHLSSLSHCFTNHGRTGLRQGLKNAAKSLAAACPTVLAMPARWYVRNTPWHQGTRSLVTVLDINQRLRPHRFRTETRFGFEISGSTEDLIQRYIYVFGRLGTPLDVLHPRST